MNLESRKKTIQIKKGTSKEEKKDKNLKLKGTNKGQKFNLVTQIKLNEKQGRKITPKTEGNNIGDLRVSTKTKEIPIWVFL